MEYVLSKDVLFNVISRLPVKTIIYSKCVCRLWRDVVSDPYFVQLHLSRSRQCLLIHHEPIVGCLDINPEGACQRLTLNFVNCLNLNLIARVPRYPTVQVGSVNGLICLCDAYEVVYIFNPVVEQCMILPRSRSKLVLLGYGFGVSMAGEYKVIRFSGTRMYFYQYEMQDLYAVEIEIYTLGTGKWRCLGRVASPLKFRGEPPSLSCLFLNNHVYWINYDGQIYDFDLNTETFELFTSPPRDNQHFSQMLGVVKGRLRRISWSNSGFTIWVLKEKESWYKATTVKINISPLLKSQMWRPLCLVSGVKGTIYLIIFSEDRDKLLAYCFNTKTVIELNLPSYYRNVTSYHPSFLKLDNFGWETVHSLKNCFHAWYDMTNQYTY